MYLIPPLQLDHELALAPHEFSTSLWMSRQECNTHQTIREQEQVYNKHNGISLYKSRIPVAALR
jgi:hypothetical protein